MSAQLQHESVSELGRVIGRLYIQEVWLSYSSDAAWEIGAADVSSTHRLLHVLSKHLPVRCQHVGSFLVQGVVRIRLLQNSSINSESCRDIQLDYIATSVLELCLSILLNSS